MYIFGILIHISNGYFSETKGTPLFIVGSYARKFSQFGLSRLA